ncbi:MAG TPA: FTR1 family protein [Candidatus Binatia bacterium]|nr:FTR1 family protein [Candidatus Binatia bacterium]
MAAFFVTLREGLEAALIVGIVAAVVARSQQPGALRSVLAGVLAAVGLSLAVGLGVVLLVGQLPFALREAIEGVAGLLAVGVLTWMLFWMRRRGRTLAGAIRSEVDRALVGGSMIALAGLAFVAVAREGLETVLFLFALGSSGGSAATLLGGGLAGLAAAVAVGYGVFALGLRLDLRRFFDVTGLVLIFVAAGLLAGAVHEFGEAGLVANTGRVLDFNPLIPENSPLGMILAGLVGYRAEPTPLEAVVYLLYVVPVLTLFVVGGRRTALATPAGSALALGLVATLLVAGCGSAGGGGTSASVELKAREYAFDPATVAVQAGRIEFRITNVGQETHEFEILGTDGEPIDEVEDIVPGLTTSLVVELEPGTYRFVCRLNGHDLLGMTGTLTVEP